MNSKISEQRKDRSHRIGTRMLENDKVLGHGATVERSSSFVSLREIEILDVIIFFGPENGVDERHHVGEQISGGILPDDLEDQFRDELDTEALSTVLSLDLMKLAMA